MREAIPLTRRCSGLASLALNSISFGDSLGMRGAEQGTIGVSARTNILLPFRAGPASADLAAGEPAFLNGFRAAQAPTR